MITIAVILLCSSYVHAGGFGWGGNSVPLGSSTTFGKVRCDGTTTTCTNGVISSTGSGLNPTVYANTTCTSTVTLDGVNGSEQSLLLGGNCTATIPVAGSGVRKFTVELTQGASPYTLTLAAGSGGTLNQLGGTFTMNTASGGRAFLYCRQTTTYIDCSYAQ
jgi:hypothetical protein